MVISIMMILQLVTLEIVFPLLIVLFMHFKLGKYPKAVSHEKSRRRVVLETLVFWFLLMIVLTLIVSSSFVEKMLGEPNAGVLALFILMTAVPYILIPVTYLKFVKGWTLSDFGLRMPLPKKRSIIIFSIILFSLFGALPFLNSNFTPLPILMIIFALWQPAFIEEFFFRGILQGNLEKAVGQNKAWIYAGLLFGLFHAPFNYIVMGMDFVPGLIRILGQTTSGWMFGILYMKTRSLWPGMIAHFLTNGIFASIVGRAL